MPASSVSSLNSWGLYVIAGGSLLLIFAPILSSASVASREGSDWRTVDGIRVLMDSLRPGVMVEFSFGTSTASDAVSIGGHHITCSYGGGRITMTTRIALQNETLHPMVGYVAELVGTMGTVMKVG